MQQNLEVGSLLEDRRKIEPADGPITFCEGKLVNSCKLYKLNSVIKLLALLPRLHFDFREVQPLDSCLL